jgi:uncharacterized protein with von Willebrand factor type A (vWA) domain
MQPYNDQMLKDILDEISTYSADYGGTNIIDPIKSITSLKTNGYKKRIFLLTDGSVGGPDSVI